MGCWSLRLSHSGREKLTCLSLSISVRCVCEEATALRPAASGTPAVTPETATPAPAPAAAAVVAPAVVPQAAAAAAAAPAAAAPAAAAPAAPAAAAAKTAAGAVAAAPAGYRRRVPTPVDARPRGHAQQQGPTLVRITAQRKLFLWDESAERGQVPITGGSGTH